MCVYYYSVYKYIYTISSPYLFVFDDDHVIRNTWADDVAGGAGEA